MKIYKFLRSPDIAAHCEKIGHVFNPLEMAVIIALSTKPIKEKHNAWREIIAEYPDMPIRGSNGFEARESLHEYLQEHIAWEEDGLNYFYDVPCHIDSVFRPFTITHYHDHSNSLGSYCCFEDTWAAISKSSEDWEEDGITHARVYKEYILDYNDVDLDDFRNSEVWLNSDGEVIEHFGWKPGLYHPSGNQPQDLDMIFVHIPVPFEKGDLVEFAGDPYNTPCVLKGLPHWNASRYEKQLSGEMSDGSDMIAWVNLMDDEGRLSYNDSPFFLYDLKYYTGKYKGYNRFLPYLSDYMKKGDEDIDILLCAYEKIKAITEYEKSTSLLDCEFKSWTERINNDR